MGNMCLNVSLLFETALAAFIIYTPSLNAALKVRELYWAWLLTGIPFALLILVTDETRKYLMRNLKPGNWVERETYY